MTLSKSMQNLKIQGICFRNYTRNYASESVCMYSLLELSPCKTNVVVAQNNGQSCPQKCVSESKISPICRIGKNVNETEEK